MDCLGMLMGLYHTHIYIVSCIVLCQIIRDHAGAYWNGIFIPFLGTC